MRLTSFALVGVVVLATNVVAEEPPYKRHLEGDNQKKAEALQQQVDALFAAGKFTEAVRPAEELLALRKRVQGEGHWEVADAKRLVETLRRAASLPEKKRRDLAEVPDIQAKAEALHGSGKYADAEASFRKALTIQEEVLGPRHPGTALSYTTLAANLDAQGHAKDAEPLHRKAVAILEEVLGPRHPDTAGSYNNLAYNLDAQGRAKEAEPLYRKALAIWEEVLGPRHPLTAQSCNNLAYNLHPQGRSKEAEPLFRKALTIREEVLGPRHPNTANSYNNLAVNLNDQGRAKDAEPLYRKALGIREEVLGPRHPLTAQSYNNLAGNLQEQGRAREADPLHRKALAIYEEVLGPRHPNTATSYNDLAYNLDAQGRAKEGEPLFRKALGIREEVLGPRHPDTANSYNNLALNLYYQGRAKEAEPLHRKALGICEQMLGPRHPYTALSYNNLAFNLHLQGQVEDAEPLWEKAVLAKDYTRLRLASNALDRAVATRIDPHIGLTACRARLGRSTDAWAAAEAGLARGLLDDLAAATAVPTDTDASQRDRDRATRLEAVDHLLTPLLSRDKLDNDDRRRRDELLAQRQQLDEQVTQEVAKRSHLAVEDLPAAQAVLSNTEALLFWLDNSYLGEHWCCVVRHSGPPAWVKVKGSGPDGTWTKEDDRLVRLVRDDLAHGELDTARDAAKLAQQRLAPLGNLLAAKGDLPTVRRLLVVPVVDMAGVPVEVLTDRYQVSYVPSASVLVRLRKNHRAITAPTLLALGDPDFRTPEEGPPAAPPDHGLYLSLVLPGGAGARAGLRAGDVLLQYGDAKLMKRTDLKLAEDGERVPVLLWRDGKQIDGLLVAPGKLGAIISDDPPAVALRKQRELRQVADVRVRGDGIKPLPGTRLEVLAIASLLDKDKVTLLLGSNASEQQLDALASSGKLKGFRLVHLATHGEVDFGLSERSALLLARDKLPGVEEQSRLAALGKKVPTGRMSVKTVADSWRLDADVVVLSACQTGLGPGSGSEGLLGFSQVLLAKGARSLVLSLWKVDDTATALLMLRFYQNLLGKREGLKARLSKAEALQEAKHWLRTLPRAEVETLAGKLVEGVLRASEDAAPPKERPARLTKLEVPKGDRPFAHPRYWAAFILLGDPD
jgi:tetratricopeptide (TPR) repeat protein